MNRSIPAAVAALALFLPASAHAASGSVSDPAGDYPDILKLTYANKSAKVVMTMKYAGARPQNESFYIKYGEPKNYQVFVSGGIGMEELRFNSKKVPCGGLAVSHDASLLKTKVVVPRSCLSKAPNKLKFQGIATEGLSSSDKTALSPWVKRG